MTREQLIGRDGRICVWCGREPWPAKDGYEPRVDLLEGALARLSRSTSHAQAEYARRQLALLGRL